MPRERFFTRARARVWLRRYLPAEILGTAVAVVAAAVVHHRTGSYALAAGAGWAGEAVGFFGYFIVFELIAGLRLHGGARPAVRIARALRSATTNLVVEFLPAELVDSFAIRPLAMFYLPQVVHPYAWGLVVAKLASDVVYYCLAIAGFELRARMRRRGGGPADSGGPETGGRAAVSGPPDVSPRG